MKDLTLEIRTPDRSLFWGRVQNLSVRAVDGQLGVYPGHAPLATLIAPGEAVIRLESGEEQRLQCGSGVLVVKVNNAFLLV